MALLGFIAVVVPVLIARGNGELKRIQDQAKALEALPAELPDERRQLAHTLAHSVQEYTLRQVRRRYLAYRLLPFVGAGLFAVFVSSRVLADRDLLSLETWDPLVEAVAWVVLVLGSLFSLLVAVAFVIGLFHAVRGISDPDHLARAAYGPGLPDSPRAVPDPHQARGGDSGPDRAP